MRAEADHEASSWAKHAVHLPKVFLQLRPKIDRVDAIRLVETFVVKRELRRVDEFKLHTAIRYGLAIAARCNPNHHLRKIRASKSPHAGYLSRPVKSGTMTKTDLNNIVIVAQFKKIKRPIIFRPGLPRHDLRHDTAKKPTWASPLASDEVGLLQGAAPLSNTELH